MNTDPGQRHCRMRRIRPAATVDVAPLELPDSTRSLSVRVACLRRPGSALPGPDGVSLAIGGRGEAPDIVFAPDTPACVVETRLELVPHDRHFDVDGRHLRTHSGAAFVELQWGVGTSRGHFLLLSGLHLRLPTFVVGSRPSGRGSPPLVLTATLALTRPDGQLRHGVVPAGDLSWLLTTDDARADEALPARTA